MSVVCLTVCLLHLHLKGCSVCDFWAPVEMDGMLEVMDLACKTHPTLSLIDWPCKMCSSCLTQLLTHTVVLVMSVFSDL